MWPQQYPPPPKHRSLSPVLVQRTSAPERRQSTKQALHCADVTGDKCLNKLGRICLSMSVCVCVCVCVCVNQASLTSDCAHQSPLSRPRLKMKCLSEVVLLRNKCTSVGAGCTSGLCFLWLYTSSAPSAPPPPPRPQITVIFHFNDAASFFILCCCYCSHTSDRRRPPRCHRWHSGVFSAVVLFLLSENRSSKRENTNRCWISLWKPAVTEHSHSPTNLRGLDFTGCFYLCFTVFQCVAEDLSLWSASKKTASLICYKFNSSMEAFLMF